ncbi:MAG: biopolymer transporter ExbD [Candidatus Firestonebacteria bacterium]|nr:biopolymer transporter ExbD [Candidatus Firestonebacteria bacterium]
MRRPAQRNRVMGEINITPLTDVMLVLLVIFMVTTPLIMKAGIDINLPKAHAQPDAPVQRLTITLSAEGKVYVDNEVVGLEQLGAVLSERFRKGADPNVTISADKQVPYGEAVRILDIARQAGAAKLVLSAEPLPAGPSAGESVKP